MTVLTPETKPFLGGLISLRPWTTTWSSRRLVRSLVKRRLQERFRGSWLGAAWVVLQPLLMLAVYAFAFVGVLGIGGRDAAPMDRLETTFSIFVGLIVFGVVGDVLQRSGASVVGHPHFVKKVVFPLDALPAVLLGESLALAVTSLAVLLVGVAAVLGEWHETWLLLPVPFGLLALIVMGAAWLLAALGVFVRDLGQVLGVATQMLFFLTPVCYRLEDVPAWARDFVAWNPLTLVIEMARGLTLQGAMPEPAAVWRCFALAAISLHVGHAVFVRLQKRFADVL